MRLAQQNVTISWIFGATGLWEISIFSFKVSEVFFSNFLHKHVLHIKLEDRQLRYQSAIGMRQGQWNFSVWPVDCISLHPQKPH